MLAFAEMEIVTQKEDFNLIVDSLNNQIKRNLTISKNLQIVI